MFNTLRRPGTRFSTKSIITKPSEYGQPTILSHPQLGIFLFLLFLLSFVVLALVTNFVISFFSSTG